MIDLTLIQHDDNSLDSYSELNMTSEETFPQLEKVSPSKYNSRKGGKRVSRSLQRGKDQNSIKNKHSIHSGLKKRNRDVLHKRETDSNHNSIVVIDQTVRE